MGGETFWTRREGGAKHFVQASRGAKCFGQAARGGFFDLVNVPKTVFSCLWVLWALLIFWSKTGENFWTCREGGVNNFGRVIWGGFSDFIFFGIVCFINKAIRERYKDLHVVWPPIP